VNKTGELGATDRLHVLSAGMFALRERRIHVTQEDFEMAVTKVMHKDSDKDLSVKRLWT
jgi:26S proteasome regulatory subunit T6